MATNSNNTVHITTFSGGMNTDTSDAYLDKTAYRMAKNLRYITDTEENSGELHIIQGASKVYDGSEFLGNVIAATSLRDLGIIITDFGNGWAVYTCDDEIRRIAKFDGSERVCGTKLSLVTRYEDYDNQKLYVADGKGPVLVIQLVPKNGEETNLNRVMSYPAVTFTVPTFDGIIGGNLETGVYEYSYQLYNKHGNQSEISPQTKMIPIPRVFEKGKKTSCGIKITIEKPDAAELFDHLRVFRIHYVENGQLPTIDVIYDDAYDWSSSFSLSDTGLQSQSVLSLEEYNSMTGIHILPKTIESKDDYMFAANIDTDNPIYKNQGVLEWGKNASNNVSASITTISALLGSYVDPKFVYNYKSLRRGETYRYGIILYDKYGNRSEVFHVCDITVPHGSAWSKDNDIMIHPVGVHFDVNNLPESIVAYEIVRCGRGIDDTKNICQGVLSRPITRIYDRVSSESYKVTNSCPLTPTGWLTTNDFVSGFGMCANIPIYEFWDNLPVPLRTGNDSISEAVLYILTNIGNDAKSSSVFTESNMSFVVETGRGSTEYFKGNSGILQMASPEYSYLQDSTTDFLKLGDIKLKAVCEVSPEFVTQYTINPSFTMSSDAGGNSIIRDVDVNDLELYQFGNEFAKLSMASDGIWQDPAYSSIITAYYEKSDGILENVDVTVDRLNAKANRFAEVKLYNKSEDHEIETKITDVGFPETLSWDDYAETAATNEVWPLKYTSRVSEIGGRNFINWVCNGQYDQPLENNDYIADSTGKQDESLGARLYKNGGAIMGPGGKCFVISVPDPIITVDGIERPSSSQQRPWMYSTDKMATWICNITREVTPYGGNNKVAIQNSLYRSYGDYFTADNTSVDVFDGDTYICDFDYISMHKYSHPAIKVPRTQMIRYHIPMETSINLCYTYGELASTQSSGGDRSFMQDQPANVAGKFVQDKPLYQYNSVYSTNSQLTTYSAVSTDEDDFNSNLDYRVYHSLMKANNENIDNWLKYQPANYLDVDTRKGPITGLRRFNNQLIFWQADATGILSVNERATITDDSDLPLILGTGGVLARYDYLSTSAGMKADEYADTQSSTTLYWWDHSKDEILAYSGGQTVLELSKVKFVQNYINGLRKDGKLIDDPVLTFDNKFNEALFTIADETLVYNEHLGQFTSVYDIYPKASIELPERVYFIGQDNSMSEWNKCSDGLVKGLVEDSMTPYLKYVVNDNALYTKVFDNGEFGGRVYGGDKPDLDVLTFKFSTPLKQAGTLPGNRIENREYNFRYVVPRNAGSEVGDRLRGKTMQCEIISESNLYDFSLQFITTKYRISWI